MKSFFYRQRDQIIKTMLRSAFEEKGKTVFTYADIIQLKTKYASAMRMSSYSNSRFLEYLTDKSYLHEKSLQTSIGAKILWISDLHNKKNDFSRNVEIMHTILPKGFVSHYSAMYYHKLTDQIPKTLYWDKEQKSSIDADQERTKLTQEVLDIAFIKTQRTAKLFIDDGALRVYKITGKYTNNAGVKKENIENLKVEVAGIERTLVDATIRQDLCGGINQVLEAYIRAKDNQNISMNKIIQIIKKMDLIYPYHQVIGFLLEKTGFDVKNFRERFECEHDFYLVRGDVNQNKNMLTYNSYWRLYYPTSFELIV